METMQRGDIFTLANVYRTKPNPDRRWWQLWKPKRVSTGELMTFRVIEAVQDRVRIQPLKLDDDITGKQMY